jgi:NADH-quinone oxidoreductase subunit M
VKILYILITATFLLILAAALSLLKNSERFTKLVSVCSLSLTGVLILYASYAAGVLTGGDSEYLELYSWQPLGTAGFRLDGLSLTFALIVIFLSLVTALYSGPYMKPLFQASGSDRWSTYYSLYLTFVFGMLGTVLATNLIEFYIFFELMLIPSYFLIAEFGHSGRDRASISYFLWTHVGALIMLAGLIVLAYSFGTLDIATITAATHTKAAGIPALQTMTLVGVAIIVGLMVKMGGFGLHVWLPGAYREAPASVSALLSGAMSGIAGYAMIRLVVLALPQAFTFIAPWLLVWGTVSLAYGGLVALAQKDIRLLLSYSSISQMGYMAIGIGSFTTFGLAGSVSLYAANAFAKGSLFMMAGTLPATAGSDSMDTIGGLAGRLPGLATFSVIGFITMMGVPPTLGFIAEFFLFQGAFAYAVSSGVTIVVPLVAILASVITSGYSLQAIRKIFYGEQKPADSTSIKDPPGGLIYPMVALGVASIILGIVPIFFSTSLSFFNASLAPFISKGGVA